MAITSANQLELLQTAEAVAREKMIDPALVVEAMEESLARAAKSRYGAEMDIRVKIDRKAGRAAFTRVRTVVDEEELENYQAELTPEQAKAYFMPAAQGRDEFWLRDGARIDPADYRSAVQQAQARSEGMRTDPAALVRTVLDSYRHVVLVDTGHLEPFHHDYAEAVRTFFAEMAESHSVSVRSRMTTFSRASVVPRTWMPSAAPSTWACASSST